MGDTEGFSSPCELEEGSSRARIDLAVSARPFQSACLIGVMQAQMPASVVITSGIKSRKLLSKDG